MVPAVAQFLDQAPPPLAGLIVAALAAPFVIAVDRVHEAVRSATRDRVMALSR